MLPGGGCGLRRSARRHLVAAGALRRANSMMQCRRKLETHLARAGVARLCACDAAMTQSELAARSSNDRRHGRRRETLRGVRSADEVGAQQERRGYDEEGSGGMKTRGWVVWQPMWVCCARPARGICAIWDNSPVIAGLRVIRHRRPRVCCPVVCVLCMQATPGPAGHPRGVLCPSGVGPGLLRAVVNTPIRSGALSLDSPSPGAARDITQ